MYTDNQIFERSDVNAFIDQLIYYVDAYFKANAITDDINEIFALSGRAANEIQGETNREGIENIIFATNSQDVFSAFYYDVQNKLSNSGLIIFKERILAYFNQISFEIWLVDTLDIDLVSGIYVQQVGTIPSKFL